MTDLSTIQSWPREQLESAFTQREKQLEREIQEYKKMRIAFEQSQHELAKALEAEKLARAGFDKAAAERG